MIASTGPHRLVADEALRRARRDWLVGQHRLGTLGVVAAGPRALGRFLGGRADGLAHLERHEPPERLAFLVEDVGDAGQEPGPLGERRPPIPTERRLGPRQLGLDLGVVQRLVGGERLASRGVDTDQRVPLHSP
jgi:hypothetical protein